MSTFRPRRPRRRLPVGAVALAFILTAAGRAAAAPIQFGDGSTPFTVTGTLDIGPTIPPATLGLSGAWTGPLLPGFIPLTGTATIAAPNTVTLTPSSLVTLPIQFTQLSLTSLTPLVFSNGSDTAKFDLSVGLAGGTPAKGSVGLTLFSGGAPYFTTISNGSVDLTAQVTLQPEGAGSAYTTTKSGQLAQNGPAAFTINPDFQMLGGITFQGQVGPLFFSTGTLTLNLQQAGAFQVNTTPEPTGLALAGLGALGACVWGWRRRSRRPA